MLVFRQRMKFFDLDAGGEIYKIKFESINIQIDY